MDLRDKADYLHQRDKTYLSHPSEDLTHCAQLLNKIGQIVQLKCELLKGIGEPVYCGYWSIIPFMVFNHQIRDLKVLFSDIKIFHHFAFFRILRRFDLFF